jgi:hypothetical protein
MKYDFQMLFVLIGIGLVSKKLTWKGWLATSLLLFAWIMFNWIRVK